MKYSEYLEPIRHGSFDFPIAYYGVDRTHPRYEMMLHWHPEYEVLRVREGSLLVTLDGEQLTVEAGDTLFISGGVMHSGKPIDCVYECLVFDLRGFAARNRIVFRQITDIVDRRRVLCTRVPRDAEGMDEVLEGLLAAMRERRPGYELTVQGRLYQLLGIVVRDHLYRQPAGGSRRHEGQQVSLKNAITYIEENYAARITLDDMARAAGMNRKYFCTFFREMTHQTPVDYLNRYRIELAGEQLLAGSQTVAEIATGCGFGDMSYFSRLFRRYMGVTPGGYRKNRRLP